MNKDAKAVEPQRASASKSKKEHMELSHLKILFFGSSSFAIPVFEALLNERIKVAAVITLPDKPAGRQGELTPTPMKVRARSQKLEVLTYQSLDEEAVEQMSSIGADLAIVASYGLLIPKAAFRCARREFVNVHPSLLPRYRGASPIQTAILNGERKTGVTIMLLDDKMDHGPILAQDEATIVESDTYETLHDRLALKGGELLVATLGPWLEEKIKPNPQDDRKATFTKMLTRDSGRIQWKMTAEQVTRQIRAFCPWPGTWTLLRDERYKLIAASPAQPRPMPLPGQMLISGDRVFVGCGHTTAIEIHQIQPSGKTVMNADSYARGYRAYSGQLFS
jgi:methionyl-tRNA formyltransferase